MKVILSEFKSQWELGKRIVKSVKKSKLIGYSFIKLIENILPIVTPLFYYILVNYVIKEKKIEALSWVILGYFGIFLFEIVIKICMKKYSNSLFQMSILHIKNDLLKKYFQMNRDIWDNQNIGDLRKRIDTDADCIEEWFNNLYVEIYGIISVGVISIILLKVRVDLSIICFIFLPISFWITKIIKQNMEIVQSKYNKKLGDFEGDIFDNLQAIDEIKSNQLEDIVLNEFDKEERILSRLFVQGHLYWFFNRTIIAFKDNLVTKIGLYFIGGMLVIYKGFNVASLLLFMEYYERMVTTILALADNSVSLAKTGTSLSRVCEVLDIPSDKIQNLSLEGDIHLKNVSYYFDDKLILDGINLDIRKGEKVAVIGSSGSGKSSLIKIMFGILKASEGDILTENLRLKDYVGGIVFNNLGIVMQENYFINDTVRNNLKLVRYNVKDQEILEACKKVNLDLGENMLDVIIGENGSKLSGGQRQRLALARLLIKNPQYLVFDEATSSLDAQTESLILKMIFEKFPNCTYIAVAHRTSAINGCHRKIVLDAGRCILDENIGFQEKIMG